MLNHIGVRMPVGSVDNDTSKLRQMFFQEYNWSGTFYRWKASDGYWKMINHWTHLKIYKNIEQYD